MDAILFFSKCSMMPRWHQSVSLMVTPKQQESAKKKSLNHISGSSWISAGLYASYIISCADPEGETGGPDPRPPPWNLKSLPKKPPPPSSVTKNNYFRWTPSHENFWIRACYLHISEYVYLLIHHHCVFKSCAMQIEEVDRKAHIELSSFSIDGLYYFPGKNT